jgi:uncharacterized protein YjbJ (UPF0337 family)
MNKPTKPWSQKKEKLKNKYASLSDEDLTYEKGKEEQLLGRIQHKLGKSKKEVKQLIKSL